MKQPVDLKTRVEQARAKERLKLRAKAVAQQRRVGERNAKHERPEARVGSHIPHSTFHIPKTRPIPSLTRLTDLGRTISRVTSKVKLPKPVKRQFRKIDLNKPLHSVLIGVIILSIILPITDAMITSQRYVLAAGADTLVGTTPSKLASKITFDASKNLYQFDKDAASKQQTQGTAIQVGATDSYSANIATDGKGVTYTDATNNLGFTLVPEFATDAGKLKSGRFVFPITRSSEQLIYSIKSNGIKEDIVLPFVMGDTQSFQYQLKLPDSLEARLLDSGDIGIYSGDLALFKNVSYGSDQDRTKLELARKMAQKTNLVFSIPAPIIKQSGTGKKSALVKAHFSLHSNEVTVAATNLKRASYPLSIDPSVVVSSATDLSQGNDETNVDTNDVNANSQVVRSAITGAKVPSWISGTALNTGEWSGAGAEYNNHYYYTGGDPGSCGFLCTPVDSNVVQIGTFSATDGSLNGWTNSGNTFTTGRKGHGTIAYNGYLYVIGGCTVAGICGTYTASVQVAKINSDGTIGAFSAGNSTGLTARADFGYAAYNGYIYLVGGCNGANCATLTRDVQYTSVKADGTLANWTTISNALIAARAKQVSVTYNGHLYNVAGCGIMSGAQCTGLSPVITEAPINADGTLGAFVSAGPNQISGTAYPAATAFKGYLYSHGGCTAMATAGNCTTWEGLVSYASINADGTIGAWVHTAASGGVSNLRLGHMMVGRKSAINIVGGCVAMDTGAFLQPAVNCASGSTLTSTLSGAFSSTSTVSLAQTLNSMTTARWGAGTIVNNGNLYVVGGCTNTGCTAVTGRVQRATISNTGALTWQAEDTTNTINGATGLAGFGLAVYNNTLYATGGWDATNFVADVSWVSLNANGTLAGAWTKQAGALSGGTTVAWAGTIAQNGYLYVLGGCNGTGPGCTAYSTSVQRATVAGGANTGTWSTTSLAALGTSRGFTAATIWGKYVYVVGGVNGGGNLSSVERATLADDGTIASWSTTSANLPSARRFMTAIATNGYLYVFGGFIAAVSNAMVYGRIDTSSTGDIASFTTDPETMSSSRWGHGSAFYNGIMYNVGGCTAGTPTTCTAGGNIVATSEYVLLNNGGPGITSTWTSGTGYTTSRTGAGSVAYNGYIYVAGGCTSVNNCTTYASDVQHAPLNSDGSVGTWVGTDPALGTARMDLTLEAFNGYLYAIGGKNGSGDSTVVEYSQIGASGVPGSWSTTNIQALTAARSAHGSAIHNGYLYVVGGSTSSTTIYYHAIASDGTLSGAWSTLTNTFTTARTGAAVTIYNNNLYLIGGYDGTNYLLDVQYVALTNTGDTSGTWHYATTLPQAVRGGDVVASNGHMYIFGGTLDGTTCASTALSADIGADGTLGHWSQVIDTFSGTRTETAATTYNGYVYVMGGGCGTTPITYATSVVYAGISAQPMLTRYSSKILDTDLNVAPVKFYAAGTFESLDTVLNTAFGTARAADALFGANYNNNNMSFAPSLYPLLAYDTSSVDQGNGRWAQFIFVIDDSQSMTFPDVTAGGTVMTNFEYFYHANPIRRLLHGKTFTGETQQSLDAVPF